MSLTELISLHKEHSWLPFTQMKTAPEPILATSGQGVWLNLSNGQKVIDGIGSWWVNTYGHSNPIINKAIANQSEKLEHVIYANFVHEPGIELANKLSKLSNHQLKRVYYSDNGSTAVEIAIKMAYQFFQNQGQNRSRIVCLKNGYHGDTFGAMSAGARSIFHKVFEPLLFEVDHITAPSCSQAGLDNQQTAIQEMGQAIQDLEDHFSKYGDQISCLLLEPIIQGAGGMNFYHSHYLKRAREICDQYGALLIADEVFTGAGRTGPFFAFEKAGVWPDLSAVSKGLSGGYIAFAATLATEKVYNAFKSDNRVHTLYHGHSMTGSPLGCAAALASLSIFKDQSIQNRLTEIELLHRKKLNWLAESDVGHWVQNQRCIGSVVAFELTWDVSYGAPKWIELGKIALEEGLFFRPLGNTVYLCPAFTITDNEIEQIYDSIRRILKRLNKS